MAATVITDLQSKRVFLRSTTIGIGGGFERVFTFLTQGKRRSSTKRMSVLALARSGGSIFGLPRPSKLNGGRRMVELIATRS